MQEIEDEFEVKLVCRRKNLRIELDFTEPILAPSNARNAISLSKTSLLLQRLLASFPLSF